MHTARQTPRHFVAPFSLFVSLSLSLSCLICVAIRFVCLRVCMLRHILERKLDKSTIEHLNFQWGPTLPVTRRSDPLNPRSPVTNDSRRRMGERLCQLRQASENFGLKVSSKPARESCFVCRLSWL